MADAIEVEGLRELNRAIRRAVDTGLPKRMGQANKSIGAFVKRLVDQESDPEAVGRGAGASVRPSASKREVLLRVGGKHRDHPNREVRSRRQWGKKVVRPGQSAPPRPYILRTADRHRDEIGDAWLDAIADAMRPAFYDTES